MNPENFENLPLNTLTLEDLANLYAFICKRDGVESVKAKELSSHFREYNNAIADCILYGNQEGLISSLEDENDSLEDELKDLRLDIASQERTISELNDKLDDFYDSDADLKDTIKNLEKDVSDYKYQIKDLRDEIKNLEKQIEKLES